VFDYGVRIHSVAELEQPEQTRMSAIKPQAVFMAKWLLYCNPNHLAHPSQYNSASTSRPPRPSEIASPQVNRAA
jgi:hypothetical protein